MKIEMQEGNGPSSLGFSGADLAVTGRALDDRGRAAFRHIQKNCDRVVSMLYHPESFELEIDGDLINAEDLDSFFDKLNGAAVTLEASTLGFVEILLCCRVLRHFPDQVSILYVEPLRYSNPRRSFLLHKRDFELSDVIPGYKAIPGATIRLTDRIPQRGVFLLGYEERRLDRAFEDYQMIRPDRCCVVFGVPAFTPGWEMDAFANNIRVIRDKNVRGGVHFCGAENPAATVNLLDTIYSGLDVSNNERMFVAPIGTKPNGIGAALFAAVHPDVGILYDHPVRKGERSAETARWHFYQIDFNA